MFSSLFSFLGRRESNRLARLATLRKSHFRWQKIPYGRPVQISKRHVTTDRLVGTVGAVLSEIEHGIAHHPGWIELARVPGIRGVHVLVKFGKNEPEIVNLFDLAPA